MCSSCCFRSNATSRKDGGSSIDNRHTNSHVGHGWGTRRIAAGPVRRNGKPAGSRVSVPPMFTRGQLDQLVLDVELVLISVVQGVALSTLAIEGGPRMAGITPLTAVYLATGLLFVLSFWSVAIIHAISFVMWPMDLGHYFFYFTLALLECLTFAQMEHPAAWFAGSLACFLVTSILYVYDYRLIL